MYNLVYNNVWGHIDPKPKANTPIYDALIADLQYRRKGYQHTWAFQHKKWDGYDTVIDTKEFVFRTGMLSRIKKIFESKNEKVKLVRDGFKQCTVLDRALTIDSRVTRHQHQIDFNDHISLIAAHSPQFRSVISSPTGTGKTIMMADAASVHQTKTLILVPEIVLLDQTKLALEKFYDAPVGMIGDGEFDLQDVTVSTLQSACSILGLRNIKGKSKRDKVSPKMDRRRQQFMDYVREVGTVIHDEVHYADNNSVMAFYEHLVSVRYIYGFSATPYKWLKKMKAVKNLVLEQHFGELEFEANDDKYDFIKMGLTVPLQVWGVPVPVRCDGFRTYNEALAEQVVENPERTEMVIRAAKNYAESGNSCFIYFRRMKHAQYLINAWGDFPPPVVSGKTSRVKRNEIFAALGKKEIPAIISDIGTVGLDIRSLDVMVLASPVQDVRQLKGRVCRACPEVNKELGIIIDPVDRTNILKKHWKARYNQYTADGNKVVGFE